MTTVHQPLRLMAEEATRMIIRLADGEQPDTPRMDLATHLVVRESTGRPPGSSRAPLSMLHPARCGSSNDPPVSPGAERC